MLYGNYAQLVSGTGLSACSAPGDVETMVARGGLARLPPRLAMAASPGRVVVRVFYALPGRVYDELDGAPATRELAPIPPGIQRLLLSELLLDALCRSADLSPDPP